MVAAASPLPPSLFGVRLPRVAPWRGRRFAPGARPSLRRARFVRVPSRPGTFERSALRQDASRSAVAPPGRGLKAAAARSRRRGRSPRVGERLFPSDGPPSFQGLFSPCSLSRIACDGSFCVNDPRVSSALVSGVRIHAVGDEVAVICLPSSAMRQVGAELAALVAALERLPGVPFVVVSDES